MEKGIRRHRRVRILMRSQRKGKERVMSKLKGGRTVMGKIKNKSNTETISHLLVS